MSVRRSSGSHGERRVHAGDVVGYRYLVKDEEGNVLAASTELVHSVHGGDSSLPPCVENNMAGRILGETFTTALCARDAFDPGSRVRRATPHQDVTVDLDHPFHAHSVLFETSIVSIRMGTVNELSTERLTVGVVTWGDER